MLSDPGTDPDRPTTHRAVTRRQFRSLWQLVRKYQDRLFTSLCHIAGAHADVEDIAQEAFVQAYRKLATFRQHCAFYTWLYRIALNLWYTRARRQRTRACLSQTRPSRTTTGRIPRDTGR